MSIYISNMLFIYILYISINAITKKSRKENYKKIGAFFDTLPVMPILSVVFKFFLLLCYADFFIKPDQAMNKEKDI